MVFLFHPALGKMEELLLDMKQDVGKISVELSKFPSISSQLKMDELSILGRLAGAGKDGRDSAQPSVITVPQKIMPNGTPPTDKTKAQTVSSTYQPPPSLVKTQGIAPKTQTSGRTLAQTASRTQTQSVSRTQTVSTIGTKQSTLQTSTVMKPGEIVVLPSSSVQYTTATPVTGASTKSGSTVATTQAYAINLPQYVDSGTVLMPAQGVPQQLVYWASGQPVTVVPGSSQATAVLAPTSGGSTAGATVQYTLAAQTPSTKTKKR